MHACMQVCGETAGLLKIIKTKVTLRKQRENMVAIICTMQIKLGANVHVCDNSDWDDRCLIPTVDSFALSLPFGL